MLYWRPFIEGLFFSADFIATDSIGAYSMGLNPSDIGYFYYSMKHDVREGKLNKIRMFGETIENCIHSFEPHSNHDKQLLWIDKKVENMINKLAFQ